MNALKIVNPFKPGAGHVPPYLAGRDLEKKEFLKLLSQETILSNLVLTGLRGVGKTVLLEELKPMANRERWWWVGTDMSESFSVNEETLARRLLADLSVATSSIAVEEKINPIGFVMSPGKNQRMLTYGTLLDLYGSADGLAADRLKYVLEFVWQYVSRLGIKGIVFAYDEAQTMSDHAEKDQYPLSLLLDMFQSIQRKGIPFMLVMVGLPTLFPKLVVARTFAERMFNIQMLDKLNSKDSEAAITKPIQQSKTKIKFSRNTIDLVVETSGGYPYFIQFLCKEIFDVYLQQLATDGKLQQFPLDGIVKKLDKDFFAGRWAKATDRQRQLLSIISHLPNCDEEFSVLDIVTGAKSTRQPFSPSHVNQMLGNLSNSGLIYKNRHGRYAFAVPLLGQFIRRQEKEEQQLKLQFE